MKKINMYLYKILQKYKKRDLICHTHTINQLQEALKKWASTCHIDIFTSGSLAKETAVSLASDVDYLISLKSNCNENNGGLKGIYDSLFEKLNDTYSNVRKQNVSVRINLNGLEVDITPARKHAGNTNDHWIYISKSDTWKQTNIQKHIKDVSLSGRTNEIKLIKIWRELYQLDFPSIYLEYLIINNILHNKSKNIVNLEDNVRFIFSELVKTQGNPLFSRIVDPANSSNILSDLLTTAEKNKIINKAQTAYLTNFENVFW